MAASGKGRYPNTGWWTRLNKRSRSKSSVLRVPIWADYFFGPSGRTGTLAATEALDTLASSGVVTGGSGGRTGTLAATELLDLAVFLGDVFVKGTFAKTEANDTLASAGKVIVKGTFAKTEVNDSIASAGKVRVAGTFSKTEAIDTGSWTGKVIIAGSLATSENGLDTFTGTGIVVVGAITGTLTSTEPADAFDARSSTPSVNAVGGPVLRHRSWSALKRWAREEEEVAAALQLLEEAVSNPMIALSDEFDDQVDKAITVIKLAVALSLKQADDAKRADLENLRQQIEIKRMELRAKAAREELEELLLLAF